MKVTLYMATSLNGIIARENNQEDFLSHQAWETTVELARETGCMIWGRKTEEVVSTWEKEYHDEIKGIKKVVVSNDKNFPLEEGSTLANSPQKALEILKKDGFEKVLLVGGSGVNSSFARENLIDEIIFNIDPVIVGKGISVFKKEDFDAKLKLIQEKNLGNGTIQVHYQVIK